MVSATRFLNADDLPLVLDFDGSVTGLDNATVLSLSHWQQRIRFGCRWSDWRQMRDELGAQIPDHYGCVFLGSGDYHHLSYLLLQRLPADQPLQLIICDNHPDNMRYPFGIHCGSWVYRASRLPQVTRIHVLGICSQDIALQHAWENHFSPLLRQKLNYWNIGVDSRWINWIGAKRCNHHFSHADDLLTAFLQQLAPLPVYFSLDKDVLAEQVVRTNWDQGRFQIAHVEALLGACADRLVGMDITGEVSDCVYDSRFKRWLSAADGQQQIDAKKITEWQRGQNQLNRQLLHFLDSRLRL